MIGTTFPALLQSFFLDRLLREKRVSPHTVAAYRDSFRLLLGFVEQHLGKAASDVALTDLDAPLIGRFLDHLEVVRGNSARTRNARLTAIHSFFRYVALREPACALQCQRVLAIPSKRFARPPIEHLGREERDALLRAPDSSTWIGRRDRALLLVAVQTGLRVSELTGLTLGDVVLGAGGHVRCTGKGRKQRSTPLKRETMSVLKAWILEQGGPAGSPLFPSSRGGRMSRDAVERLVARHAAAAAKTCPTLAGKRVTPHVLRHTAAMDLLQAGVDRTVIAIWLGHESAETTRFYLHADMRLKERALAKTTDSGLSPARYRPGDSLLAFLESL